MTADQRTRIRAARDQHARNQRNALIQAGELQVCGGCGCDNDIYSSGCATCHDRKRRRARRANPVLRAQERVRWMEASRRRRARARA